MTNVLFVGVGGQGVLTAARILAEAAFTGGFAVTQSEVHGMSQRGGSVECQVRFGEHVASPLMPAGEADILLALGLDEECRAKDVVRPGGVLVSPAQELLSALPHPRTLNVAMLGVLSTLLPFPVRVWRATVQRVLPAPTHDPNLQAFALGRRLARDSQRTLSEHGRQTQRPEAAP